MKFSFLISSQSFPLLSIASCAFSDASLRIICLCLICNPPIGSGRRQLAFAAQQTLLSQCFLPSHVPIIILVVLCGTPSCKLDTVHQMQPHEYQIEGIVLLATFLLRKILFCVFLEDRCDICLST